MTKPSRKAIIIGAGIAGPVTGILLKKAGIDAQVFEAWPYSAGIGGGLQIAPNGMHVLAEIGLAEDMIRSGSIAESFDFHSQSGARIGSINRNMKARFGQPAVNMRRATLNEAIINKAWCENVELAFEKRLVRIEDRADQPVIAHFADGTSAEPAAEATAMLALPMLALPVLAVPKNSAVTQATAAGRGCSRKVTSVISPSVPCDPQKSLPMS